MLMDQKELAQKIDSLSREIKHFPSGNIFYSYNGNSLQWYQYVEHSKKLIPSKELELKKEQTKSQIELAKAEIEFNKARTALVTAQTTTEAQKKNAVIREIASYDDQQRIKEAEIITNAVFGYASGGVAVPSELSSKMLSLIDKITPNS